MKTNFTMTGAEDLKRTLANLPSAVSRKVQLDALKAGAEPIRAMAESLAPRDESGGDPHLAHNIIIAVPTISRSEERGIFDQPVVDVGPSTRTFWGYFQEFGTAFHPAQPFMRPAFDSQVRRSIRIVGVEVWAAIKRRLGSGGRSASGRAA